MAGFRTQDLVINALPKQALEALQCIWGTRICLRPTVYCQWPTIQTCWRWTPITCWQWTCGLQSCFRFTLECPGRTVACPIGTECFGGSINCPAGSRLEITDITTVINPELVVINDVADIKTLRTQLGEVMEELAELEKRGLDAGVRGAGNLEEMENQLKQALKEVQEQRRKGGGGGGGGGATGGAGRGRGAGPESRGESSE